MKKVFWTILWLVIAFLTVFIIVKSGKDITIDKMILFISKMDIKWSILSIILMVGFIVFLALSILTILKGFNVKKRLREGIVYASGDVYFSAITPSASGGQAVCAYFMVLDKISGSLITLVLLINMVLHIFALLSLGLISIILKFNIVRNLSIWSKLLIIFGAIFLSSISSFIILVIRKENILRLIIYKIIDFLGKIKILKNPDKRKGRLEHLIKDYAIASKAVFGKGEMLRNAFIFNILQRLCQVLIPFSIILGRGYGIEKASQVFFLQVFVALGSFSVPIPGAMGAAEYILFDGLKGIIGEDYTYIGLMSRGISFYLLIILSGIITLFGYFYYKYYKNKK